MDDLESEGNFCIGVADQVLANTIYVFGDHRVVDQLRRTFDFLSQSLAQGDFPLQREEVHAFTDISITDGVDFFLGILGSYSVFLLHRLGPRLLLGLLLGRRWGFCRILSGRRGSLDLRWRQDRNRWKVRKQPQPPGMP